MPLTSRTCAAIAWAAAALGPLAPSGPAASVPHEERQLRATPPAQDTLSDFSKAKAHTLLRDRLPCLGCHQLDGEGGRIGPDLSNVGGRRDPAYVLAMIRDPQRTVPGTAMPMTPMTEKMLALVAGYLSGRGGPPPTSNTPPRLPQRTTIPPLGGANRLGEGRTTASVSDGASSSTSRPDAAPLYARHCAACHGARGGNDGFNARHLPVPPARHASAAAMSRRPDDALYDAIAAGGYVMNRSNRMPAFGQTLSPAEIRALVRHIRRLCGCEGPTWSRDGSGRGR